MLQLYSFDSGYSLDVLGNAFLSVCWGQREGEVEGEGREDQYYKNKIPEHSFPFFLTTIKLIYTLVFQSLYSYFSSLF